MKRIILALLMFGLTSSSFAQVLKTTDSVAAAKLAEIPDSSKVTFSKVYNDVKGGLEGLAKALKTGAAHVYEVLVRQQVVEAITWLIILSFLFASTIYTWRLFAKNYKRTSNREDSWYKKDIVDKAGLAIPMILAFIFTLLSVIIFLVCISTIITGFINPEYGALKEIMKLVR